MHSASKTYCLNRIDKQFTFGWLKSSKTADKCTVIYTFWARVTPCDTTQQNCRRHQVKTAFYGDEYSLYIFFSYKFWLRFYIPWLPGWFLCRATSHFFLSSSPHLAVDNKVFNWFYQRTQSHVGNHCVFYYAYHET